GKVNWIGGIIALMAYLVLLIMMNFPRATINPTPEKKVARAFKDLSFWIDIAKILVLSGIVFIAGNVLVEEATFFAEYFKAPQYLIGILLLSFGTNIPEIAVAVRSVLKKRADVALGN